MKAIIEKSQYKGENYPNLYYVSIYEKNEQIDAQSIELPTEEGMVCNTDAYIIDSIRKELDIAGIIIELK